MRKSAMYVAIMLMGFIFILPPKIAATPISYEFSGVFGPADPGDNFGLTGSTFLFRGIVDSNALPATYSSNSSYSDTIYNLSTPFLWINSSVYPVISPSKIDIRDYSDPLSWPGDKIMVHIDTAIGGSPVGLNLITYLVAENPGDETTLPFPLPYPLPNLTPTGINIDLIGGGQTKYTWLDSAASAQIVPVPGAAVLFGTGLGLLGLLRKKFIGKIL